MPIKLDKFIKNPRERVMALCVLLIGAALWWTMLSKKSTMLNAELAQLEKREKRANAVLNNSAAVDAEFERLAKAFDKTKTYHIGSFQAFVEKCAKDAGLGYRISPVAVSKSGRFEVFSLELSFDKADNLLKLAKFENQLRKAEPYITIAETVFDSDGKGAISGKYNLSAFRTE